MAVRIAVQKLLVRAGFNSSPIQSSSIFSQISSASSPICRPSFDRFLGNLSQINSISSSKANVLFPISPELVRNRFPWESILGRRPPWNVKNRGFHSLGDERLPKRRPCMKNRKKRAALRPKGESYSTHCHGFSPLFIVFSRRFVTNESPCSILMQLL